MAAAVRRIKLGSVNEVLEVRQTRPVNEVSVEEVCAWCEYKGHTAMVCPGFLAPNWASQFNQEEVNAVRTEDPYSNTYNPRWRDHPNLGWSDPKPAGGVPAQPLVLLSLQQFPRFQSSRPPQARGSSTGAHYLGNPTGPNVQGPNLEEAKAVTILMSGKAIDKTIQSKPASSPTVTPDTANVPRKEVRAYGESLEVVVPAIAAPTTQTPPAIPLDPFPQRLAVKPKQSINHEMLDLSKQVQLPITLFEITESFPHRAKVLDDLCTPKTKNQNNVVLTEVVSPIFEVEIPAKCKDPGCPTIPITIAGQTFDKALLDSGAGINLLSYSEYLKLGLGNLKAALRTLQFADNSVKVPKGVVEDVMIQVGEFQFPADFIVLDTCENPAVLEKTTIILGRPFLATSNAVISYKTGKIQLSVGEKTMEMDVFSANTSDKDDEAVSLIDTLVREWSLWSRDIEADIVPTCTCRELGVGIVTYSPLGRGFLSGGANLVENSPDGDFRKALKGGWREKVQLATKFGISNKGGAPKTRGDPEYVREACERSLKRLEVDYIDLYYQHPIDTTVPIEVTIKALKELIDEGKIKYIGLSEASSSTIRRAHAVHPITAVQMEWSLWSRDIEADIVPTCRELGIGIVTYSPLGRGFLSGGANLVANFPDGDFRKNMPRFKPENVEHNKKIFERVNEMARRKGCTPSQLALALVHHQGNDVFPIPGTTKIENFNQNIGALSVKLTPEEMAELESYASADAVKGDRHVFMSTTWINSETPPLSSWKPE